MPSIELKKFNFNKLKEMISTIVVIGERKVGKTTVVKNILNDKYSKKEDTGQIISPSKNEHEIYQNYLYSTVTIKNEFNNEVLNNNTDKYIVLDDYYYNDKWTESNKVVDIIVNKTLDLIIVMQYPSSIYPSLRQHIDYVFIFKNNNYEKIYNEYASLFTDYYLFDQFMKCISDKYECLVIDNTIDSINWVDKVFYCQTKI
jgi:GTPase SAR1 family protein